MTLLVRRFADADALAQAAADEIVAIATACIAARGSFSIALSGGSTPKRLHAALVARGRDAIDYTRVAFYWGDERGVPPDHPDSNYRMARETLLEPLGLAASSPVSDTQIHRMPTERADREQAAADYAARLPPALDLVLLGMGDDGHTLSLFPDTAALEEKTRLVVINDVPQKQTWRMTLTYPAVAAARRVRFLVAGADKAKVLAEVLEGPPLVYPSQRITARDLAWFVDDAAAAQLKEV